MLVVRRQRLDDLVMIQQPGGIPGVFRKDKIHFFQHFECPERNILQITDGRRNYIEQKYCFTAIPAFRDL
jgi:hypothetical protein